MKLVHEDADTYHIKLPSGQVHVLTKSKLTPESHAMIKNFDEGGQAQPSPSPNPNDPSSMGVPNDVLKAFKMADGGQPSLDPRLAPGGNGENPPPDSWDPSQGSYDPTQVEQNGIVMSGPMVHKAKGGDVMGHQTTHKPNPKLGQVPQQDRFPGAANTQPIVQHFYMGGTPQNFANGSGFVQPEQTPPPDYVTAPTTNPPSQAVSAGAPATAQPPAVAPAPPMDTPESVYGAAENQALGAQQAIGEANKQAAQSDVGAYDTEAKGLSKAPDIQAAFDEYHQKYDNMVNNMNPTIDPGHFWSSKDTPNKIMAAVGFMLGGAGLGASGHPELAMKGIQDAINNDIEAQKATFNNKDNLLRAYSNQFNSAIMGEQATRLHLQAQAENLVRRAAAQAGTQTAIPAAQLLQSNIRQQAAGNMVNLAMQTNQYRVLHDPAAMAALPLSSKIMYTLPQDQQAEAQKQATNYAANQKSHENIDQLMDQLDQEQSITNLPNPQSYSRVKQIMAGLTPAILDASPSKRLTKESIDTEIAPFKFSTFADKTTRDSARARLHQIVDNSSDPMNLLTDHGLIPKTSYQVCTKTTVCTKVQNLWW
jgi:hypothetical protein